MTTALSYVIKFVGNMDDAVRFHSARLGLKLRFQSPEWSEFETGQTTLALHQSSAEHPAGTCQRDFRGADIDRFYSERVAEGVQAVASPYRSIRWRSVSRRRSLTIAKAPEPVNKTHDITALQEMLEPLLPGLMGVRLLDLAADRVVAEMSVRADLCTSGGILHGGAYMAFADTLGAVGTVLNLPAGKRTTTTDSSTKFMAGARVNTTITGESVALHRGRTTMVWQTSIRNADGKLCAVVTQTQLVLEAAS